MVTKRPAVMMQLCSYYTSIRCGRPPDATHLHRRRRGGALMRLRTTRGRFNQHGEARVLSAKSRRSPVGAGYTVRRDTVPRDRRTACTAAKYYDENAPRRLRVDRPSALLSFSIVCYYYYCLMHARIIVKRTAGQRSSRPFKTFRSALREAAVYYSAETTAAAATTTALVACVVRRRPWRDVWRATGNQRGRVSDAAVAVNDELHDEEVVEEEEGGRMQIHARTHTHTLTLARSVGLSVGTRTRIQLVMLKPSHAAALGTR